MITPPTSNEIDTDFACCGFVDLLGLKALHTLPFEIRCRKYQQTDELIFPFFSNFFADLNNSMALTWFEKRDMHYATLFCQIA